MNTESKQDLKRRFFLAKKELPKGSSWPEFVAQGFISKEEATILMCSQICQEFNIQNLERCNECRVGTDLIQNWEQHIIDLKQLPR